MTHDYLQRLPSTLRITGKHTLGEIELLPPGETGEFGVAYEDNYILLVRDRVRFPGGAEGGYIRLINKGELYGSPGVVMIPLWSGGVVFIRIFRHATRSWEWELPRGFHEPGHTEEENARKEILEELGVEAASARKVGAFNANTGLLTGFIGAYAVNLTADPAAAGAPQKAESIREFRRVAVGGLRDFIASGDIRCGISLAALMLYLHCQEPTLPENQS